MKFQTVLVFFAGALALAAPIEERDLPVVGTLGSATTLAKSAKGAAGKVAPSAVDNLPAGGLVKGLPLAGGLLGGGAMGFEILSGIGDITSHFWWVSNKTSIY
ncbi:hypothetical protein H112_03468 [Trichophyton rubrum D6]|uniref:Uncharacterized protein n=2 Tax=Trichophyton TaxID=5550 RepID=A0A022W5Q9_TRIRU|nr:hypothetical protein H100_03472 [Trichophyton rubrum MR850]EZF42999.1 hypothetical protein H102_03467 [Trichophyton rubrum CBS 100081]EZF53599.1 hypothetical protein H103_03477 [Trichophyton rubrum CBS 288.86]EZF64267.1 hypothetical protein H104_03462 [Trichophyton rubrum CBS 289.86]EZF74805.1 hypothetical protein H105_03489 [Trichophyton soudanense CBS 452.61]EZF85562.1 hypothetical protein H110_03473 [Trichophyton rubrum MR1448]EZG17749.1 hypothetical protein H107_03583 [Trichophyton rub